MIVWLCLSHNDEYYEYWSQDQISFKRMSSSTVTLFSSKAISKRPTAFQAYPWLTAIPLVEGKLKEAIDEAIADACGIDDRTADLLSVCDFDYHSSQIRVLNPF
jgi:hypothetical protein